MLLGFKKLYKQSETVWNMKLFIIYFNDIYHLQNYIIFFKIQWVNLFFIEKNGKTAIIFFLTFAIK